MIKKLHFLFLVIFLSIGTTMNAQCLLSDKTLETQADVDEFISLYSTCSSINYNLTIGSNSTQGEADPITDISGLSFITTFEKGLYIQYTDLTNLNGLQNVTVIGTQFYMEYNNLLTSLNGVEGLVSIGTESNSINYLLINSNPVLTDLTALQNLVSIDGGQIGIVNCNALTNLTGLQNINGTTLYNISINNNPLLSNCSIASICEAINTDGLVSTFNNNASGCSDIIEVAAGCGGFSGCPTSTVSLATQSEVNFYLAAYPNCTEFVDTISFNLGTSSGDPYGADPITDISGFINYTNFYNITIRNTALTDLTGLNNLTTVTRNLYIRDNPFLESFNGLNNLTSVNTIGETLRYLYIYGNESLTDISALTNLTSVNNGKIRVRENAILTNLSGLDNVDVTNIDEYEVYDNPLLVACSVQSLCTAIDNGSNITISNNATGCNDTTEVSVNCGTDFCPSGDVTLTSQAEVDAFIVSYPFCTSIGGILTVNGSDVTNLNGIANIHYTAGLVIQNTQLTTLNDISINGVNGILNISNNTQLTNIVSFSNLTELSGGLTISNNDVLSNLSGLENLVEINTASIATIGLEITDNATLSDISDLADVKRLNNSELIIENNSALTTLTGLDTVLASTISNLSILNNSSLVNASVESICIYLNNSFPATISGNATGATTIAEVEANCSLAQCPIGDLTFANQEDLDYFKIQYPNCTEIDGNLKITHLDNNEDLSGLDNITSVTGSLEISYNDSSTFVGLQNVTSIGGLDIKYCDNLINLQSLNGLQQISGSIYITDNNSLLNLTGLESVSLLSGEVNIFGNPSLENLQGLNGVTIILPNDFSGVSIRNNVSLTSLAGLNNLQSVFSDFSLRDLPLLTDLSGLSNLSSITGGFYIQECDALTSFSGLTNFNHVYGKLHIYLNDNIQNLEGLNALQTFYGLTILGNPNLTNIQALSNVTTAVSSNQWENLEITLNPSLQNLDGLEGITFVGNLLITENTSLTSISGLQNVTDIGAGIVVSDNINLTSLNGLNNVQSLHQSPFVSGSVSLYFSTNALINLNPLSNITTTVSVAIGVENENSITDLSGLNNIIPEEIFILLIRDNELLSTCHVESVCGYLDSSPDPNYYLIENNTGGCNTDTEVLAACASLGVEESYLDESISLYPNPTENALYLSVKNGVEIETISVYNMVGQQIRTLNGSHELISVSTFSKGVYFVEITTKTGEVYTKKVIKN